MARNNLFSGWKAPRTGWKKELFGSGMTGVPVERVMRGHLMLEHDGALLDLGPCTLEDLRLIAFVAQEAYIRLPSKRGRSKSTPGTLARARNRTRQFWQASLDPDNLRKRVPGRDEVGSVAEGVDGVVSGVENLRQAEALPLDPASVE